MMMYCCPKYTVLYISVSESVPVCVLQGSHPPPAGTWSSKLQDQSAEEADESNMWVHRALKMIQIDGVMSRTWGKSMCKKAILNRK
jgi:hypothetical protein